MNGFREPTREELGMMQARRDRSDKISKIMGEYLLKGYRMLDSYCPECTVSPSWFINADLAHGIPSFIRLMEQNAECSTYGTAMSAGTGSKIP